MEIDDVVHCCVPGLFAAVADVMENVVCTSKNYDPSVPGTGYRWHEKKQSSWSHGQVKDWVQVTANYFNMLPHLLDNLKK